MKLLVALGIGLMLVGKTIAAPVSQEFRKNFIEPTIANCVEMHSATPPKDAAAKDSLHAFCKCVAQEVADTVTAENAETLTRTGDAEPFQKATQKAYVLCSSVGGIDGKTKRMTPRNTND